VILVFEAIKKDLKHVQRIFGDRYKDPYFATYLKEYRKLQDELGGVGSPEPPLNITGLSKALDTIGAKSVTIAEVIDSFLEYILESDMAFGAVFPTDIGFLMDCLLYIVLKWQRE